MIDNKIGWGLGGRQFSETEHLICGIWYYLQVDSGRIELNFRTQAGVRELLGVEKKIHTLELASGLQSHSPN